MTRVFSAEAQLHAMMRFEWALTLALEKQGLAAAGSGVEVEALLDATWLDRDALQREAAADGNIAIPFVRQLTQAVSARRAEAARSVHLGATSQDVLDTALVLQMREAWKLLTAALKRLDQALVAQIQAHTGTVLLGRTWLQQAPPTTLGLKLAGTLAALRRHRARLRAAGERVLVLQMGGAVGTLAALGAAGEPVAAEVAAVLSLKLPSLPWHTQRDSLAETVTVLALLTGTLAKFATDVALLMQSEVGEAAEAPPGKRGGSSTMPHKHNPVACAAVIAVHTTMPGLAATMLAALPQQHERGLGLWQAEWATLPEAFRRAAAALAYATDIAEGLQADTARMQANLVAALGLPLAEAVSSALAPGIGRARAHALLREAAERAASDGRSLAATLKQMPEVVAQLSPAEIDRLLDPRHYLGSAGTFIARALGEPHGRD